jgi:murein DD-endopeptidase MepM/ murein hydrolase activator NlpD
MTSGKYIFLNFLLVMLTIFNSCTNKIKETPLRVIAELNTGESQNVLLSNGESVNLKLIAVQEFRDSLRNAIRSAIIKVSVDGEEIDLNTGNYNLPIIAGKVQVDCPAIKGYLSNETKDNSRVIKEVTLRLWPKDSPYMRPQTFVYPIKQRWFASMTQSGNEPTWVDWGETPGNKEIYYHYGHDIGGAEGMDEIVSATEGVVIAANMDTLKGYTDFPGDVRMDVVYIVDNLGWYYRYSHLDSVDPAIKPGVKVKPGQKIGFIGKQGHSGGWVHLHFEISSKDEASGAWITEDAYPYCWEAFVKEYHPAIIAVARPHHLAWNNQEVILNGRKSRSLVGDIVSYEWIFTDGTTANGATQKRSYPVPGEYSEILKVTDSKGNIDYDFAVVQVYDRANPDYRIPVLQPAYYPTLNIKAGDPVTFLVRTFNTAFGNEVWDFGDRSQTVSVKSDTVDRKNPHQGKFAAVTHVFSNQGHFVVKVERADENGIKAIGHLDVIVN